MKFLKTTLCASLLSLALTTPTLAGNIGGMRTSSAGNIGGMRTNQVGNIGGLKTEKSGNIGGLRADARPTAPETLSDELLRSAVSILSMFFSIL